MPLAGFQACSGIWRAARQTARLRLAAMAKSARSARAASATLWSKSPESARTTGRRSPAQSAERPGDERGRLGTGVASARAEIGGQHETGFGPDGRVRSPGALAQVIEGRALFLQPVGLDVGRVEIDGRAAGGQGLPAGAGEQGEPPASERTHRCLDVTEKMASSKRLARPMNAETPAPTARPAMARPAWSWRAKSRSTIKSPPESIVSAIESTTSPTESPPPAARPLADVVIERGADRHDAIELGDEGGGPPSG